MVNYIYTPPNFTNGVDGTLVDVANTVPTFPVMILVFVYLVVALGGAAGQKKRTGSTDFPFWCALAGLFTTFIAITMTLGDNLINLPTLSVTIAVAILSAFWFFMSKQRGEI